MSNCKWNTEKVKDFINSNNCEYIKGEYKNEKSIFTIRCACGDIFEKSFKAFKSGQMQCKKCGYKKGGKIISEKQILNGDYIKSEVNKTGCELLSPYINSKSPMLIRCKCGEIFEKSWKCFKSGQQQCPKCGHKKMRESIKRRINTNCSYCGKEIEILQCEKKYNSHFCSVDCQYKYRSKQM